jgi:hypothetical protein
MSDGTLNDRKSEKYHSHADIKYCNLRFKGAISGGARYAITERGAPYQTHSKAITPD